MLKACSLLLSAASTAIAAVAPSQQEECKTIAELAQETPELSFLLGLAEQVDLPDAFNIPKTTQLTVFAPSNDVFDEETRDSLTNPNLTDKDELRSILFYHVTFGGYSTQTIEDGMTITMLNQRKANFTVIDQGVVMINDATIIQPDIPACGGSFIHITDRVLIPPTPGGSSTVEEIGGDSGPIDESDRYEDSSSAEVSENDYMESNTEELVESEIENNTSNDVTETEVVESESKVFLSIESDTDMSGTETDAEIDDTETITML